jgi:uncharacterized coiled-coil DUF342 family protein
MRWARGAIFGLICLLVAAPALFAGGQDEQEQQDPIEQARSLVEEGRLNEAILLLQETVRDNPERIRQAEELLTRIRKLRGDYNTLFSDLIGTLRTEPDNLEKMLSIIDQMEQLDESPNERVQEQVSQARVVAQLAYDREQVRQLMETAAEQIAAGNYVDAVQTYLSGFEFQRREFEEREYPQMFESVVNNAVETLRQAANNFPPSAAQYRAAAEPLSNALSAGRAEVLDARFPAYSQRYQSLSELAERVAGAGESIAAQREQVPQVLPEQEVDWYLTFLESYVFGRQGSRESEGILTAVRRTLRSVRDRIDTNSLAGTESVYAEGVAAYDEESWEEAEQRFFRTETLARYGVQNSVLHEPSLETPALESALELLQEEAVERYLTHHTLLQSAGSLGRLASLRDRVGTIIVEEESTIEALEETRGELNELVSSARSLVGSVRGFRDTATNQAAASWGEASRERFSAVVERAQETEALVTERELSVVRRLAARELTPLTDTFETLSARTEAARELLSGITSRTAPPVATAGEGAAAGEENTAAADQAVPEDGGTAAAEEEDPAADAGTGGDAQDEAAADVLYRYPEVALSRLQQTEPAAAALAERVAGYLQEYRGEPQYVREDEEVASLIEEAETLQQELSQLQTTLAQARISAENQIARAEQLRQEYRDAVAQAEEATENLNIQRAEQAFQTAQETSLEALELQQIQEFREQRDQTITRLGDALQDARNRIVVQQVRQLISDAQQLYDTEQFIQARNTLNRARELWSQTNVNENPEIERLAGLVNVALEFEQERNVNESEPLYAVLSGYLNVARERYNRAVDLRQEGSTQQARDALERASGALDNVLAIRPYNWEARVLKLRILERQNPEDFEQLFERRYEDALDSRDENPQEALTSLETLNQINPEYPGIDQQIRQLEISLGLRPDPVEQAEIQRSNELLAQARELASGGGTPQIQSAMQLLQQALQLNPNNSEAQLLLDELRIQSGGEATAALNSEDQQRFQNAQDAFLNGNVATALSIVNRLMQSEENRQYPPLRDLVANLEQALGRELEFN